MRATRAALSDFLPRYVFHALVQYAGRPYTDKSADGLELNPDP
jgi:hypothetical protein